MRKLQFTLSRRSYGVGEVNKMRIERRKSSTRLHGIINSQTKFQTIIYCKFILFIKSKAQVTHTHASKRRRKAHLGH